MRESHPTKLLNVWGAIWYDGKTTLHVTNENFDQDYYVAVLQEHLAPDNYHWVGNALSRIVYHGIGQGGYWIGVRATEFRSWKISQPPDLNAIEYVWGWMEHSVAAREPHNYETLQAAILAAWDELPQTTILRFIDHINSVIEEIIAADGGHSH